MSTEAKYQVMCELLDIHPAAWEKAEEQASRIIAMVKGGCSCTTSLPCGEATLSKLNKLFPSEPGENFTASVKVLPAKPKHHPIQTDESKALTAKIVSLRNESGKDWKQIAAEVGLSKDAARTRYRDWQKKQKEFYGTPKEESKNDIEPISPEEDLLPLKALIKKIEPMLYEPGAEEASLEADLAEANRIFRAIDIDDQIGNFIRGMIRKDPHAMDYDILQAVKRNFPGISMTAGGIAYRRREA